MTILEKDELLILAERSLILLVSRSSASSLLSHLVAELYASLRK